MNNAMILASVIFVSVYGLIISEKIHRTVIALSGAVLMIVLGFINQDLAVEFVDFNTIGLLTGMMLIVIVTKRTGFFEYIAIRAAKAARGEPQRLLIYFVIITAVASALLDNVTTVLLVAPVTIAITDTLEINPIPFLLSEVIASNIGGTATLIGDPPNIMIGSAVGLGFLDFIVNLTPVILVIGIVSIFVFKLIYRKQLYITPELKEKIMLFNENDYITDRKLLRQSLLTLGLVILGFFLHQKLGLESATVALFGAALLLLISRIEPHEILHEVEWTTIFFFIGLFVMVGTLEHLGIIKLLAQCALSLTGDNVVATGLLILWISAIASAFIDNIPFVATMIPLINAMGQIGGIDVTPLWWSLSLGACLGGNGTLIGASANLVVAGIAGKHGNPISFKEYFKIGFPMMLLSVAISTVYIYFVYLC